MIQGLLFHHIDNDYRLFCFESPSEAFHNKPFTIIGASVENNLVMIGPEAQYDFPVANIGSSVLNEFVFDDPPRGDVLFMLTTDSGIPASIDSVDHLSNLVVEN